MIYFSIAKVPSKDAVVLVCGDLFRFKCFTMDFMLFVTRGELVDPSDV